MDDLPANATRHLQTRYPTATVLNFPVTVPTATSQKPVNVMVAHNFAAGTLHGLIAVPNLGLDGDLDFWAPMARGFLEHVAAQVEIQTSHPQGRIPRMNTKKMVFAPVVTLYTNDLFCSVQDARSIFESVDVPVDIVSEAELHSSLFISYGGPDEQTAAHLNQILKSRGVKTWFFPVDALPGQKLHRMMHDGINSHDRILLICSQSSLTRPGVLNEIERVLEKEARTGGADILMPVTVDDYVFSEWSPDRSDVAEQVRTRVISRLPNPSNEPVEFAAQVEKIFTALRKTAKS